MLYSDPVAYFLTWTTYGSWLPGDERGWIDSGKGFQLPNPKLLDYSSGMMTEDVCYLSNAERQLVEAQIAETCRFRGWTLHAVNCRSNHVHAVITALNVTAKKVHDDLKAWCTRRLKKSNPERLKWWTEGGSQQLLFTDQSLQDIIFYVMEAQDRKCRELG
jgi:REP element-mobilizing transposase RayT